MRLAAFHGFTGTPALVPSLCPSLLEFAPPWGCLRMDIAKYDSCNLAARQHDMMRQA